MAHQYFPAGFGRPVFGALLKIRRWPGADETITIAPHVVIAALVFAIIKTLLVKKTD